MRMRPDGSTGYPGRTYRFYTGPTIYPFGYGLSYTNFTHAFALAPSALTAPSLQEQVCDSRQPSSSGLYKCSKQTTGIHLLLRLTASPVSECWSPCWPAKGCRYLHLNANYHSRSWTPNRYCKWNAVQNQWKEGHLLCLKVEYFLWWE